MADIYSTDLPGKATEIRNEPDAGENTATRVGDMFLSIIDYISQNEEDWLRDTGGTGQDQLQLPVGLTGLLGSLSTVSDIPSGQNKIIVWKNADANPNGWGYLTTPTGGTGTGSGDVTWSQLTTTALQGHQIDGSHLTNALSNYLTNAKLTNTGASASKYTWWGRYLTPSTSGGVTNYKVEGPLSGGITYIQFSNGVRIEAIAGTETTSPALRVVDANTTAGTADFYAMGGVSALGRSSSSSGGGGDTPVVPTDLGAILNHVKNNTASVNPVPSPIPEGATIRWNGDDAWVVDKTTWGDLGAVAPGFTANGINYLLKCSTSNGGYSYSYEWIPISSGSGNVTLLSNVGDVAAYSPSADGILTYVNGASELEKWQYKRFLINPSASVDDYSTATLSSIILGGTKYNVPTYSVATQQAAGLLSAADKAKLDGIASGANNYSHPTGFTVKDTSNFYKYTVNSNGHVTAGDALSGSDLKSLLNGQTNVGISISGNAATATKLADTSTKTIWGQTYWSGGQPQNVQGDLIVKPNPSTSATVNTVSFMLDTRNVTGGNPESNSVLRMLGKNIIDVNTNNSSKKTVDITFGGENTADKFDQVRIHSKEGIYMPNAISYSSGLIIGGMPNDVRPVLYWDSRNNALALQMSDGSAANFYATGGVSALGMSPGTSSIDAMTFGVVDITSSLKIKLGNTNNKATIYTNTGTGLIIDNPYGGISINDLATYINDITGDTYFGGDENTNGGKIYICLASQGYEYYRLDVDKLQRDGYLTLD